MAFDVLPYEKSVPIGYQLVQCHMIFNIKMDDFRQKARLVAGGHTTKAPATITYLNVASRKSVRIFLMIA